MSFPEGKNKPTLGRNDPEESRSRGLGGKERGVVPSSRGRRHYSIAVVRIS